MPHFSVCFAFYDFFFHFFCPNKSTWWVLRPFSSWMMIPKSAQIQTHWTCGKNWVGKSSLLPYKLAVNLWRAHDWHRSCWNSHHPVGYCTLEWLEQVQLLKSNEWIPKIMFFSKGISVSQYLLSNVAILGVSMLSFGGVTSSPWLCSLCRGWNTTQLP